MLSAPQETAGLAELIVPRAADGREQNGAVFDREAIVPCAHHVMASVKAEKLHLLT